MLKLRPGFVFVVPLIIALLIVGGGMYGVYKIYGDQSPKATPTPSPSSSPINNPFPQATQSPVNNNLPERQMTPDDAGGPIKQASNITGKWVGRYTITAPFACNGESGGWTANLVDTNGVLSGSFSSDGGSGSISGSYSGNRTNFSIGGGGSGISFSGSISGNTMSGAFKGPDCDDESGSTSGTFFGGK